MRSVTEIEKSIIDELSLLIRHHSNLAANEQCCPGPDPDQMDDIIKDNIKKVKSLRDIRETLENLFTGVIL